MPFSSGVFSRLYNWVTEGGSPPISIAKLDTQEEDFKTAFNNCLLRDGTGVPTAATPWNAQNLSGVGALTGATINMTGTITGATSITGASFIPTGATVPANGLYLSGANQISLSSNTVSRFSISADGHVNIAVPTATSTATLTVNGAAARASLRLIPADSNSATLEIQDPGANSILLRAQTSNTGGQIVVAGTNANLSLNTNTGVVIPAPSTSGQTLTLGNGTAITAGGSLVAGVCFTSTSNFGVFTGSGAPTITAAKGSLYLRSDGSSTSTRMYVATDSAGTWTAVTTVA